MTKVTIIIDNEHEQVYEDVVQIRELNGFVELHQGDVVRWVNKIDISSLVIEPQAASTPEEIKQAFKAIKHGTD
jgi:hypothetical protein